MSSATCYVHCVACIRLEAVLDVRCQLREDVVEWSGCRSDSAVLKGVANGDVLSRPAGRCVRAFRVTAKMIMASALLWAHGMSACGCVASVLSNTKHYAQSVKN